MIAYRFEILIPLYYNDGTEIEPEKHLITREELLHRFHEGLTWIPANALGLYIYKGARYTDRCDLLFILTDETKENLEFMREYKETLKDRYEQHEILIYVTKVEIL